MAAPTKNQNAAKPEETRADSFLHIRIRREDKAYLVNRAQARGMKLSEYVLMTLGVLEPPAP